MIAGPNGSGKSTLTAWLMHDYAVNFYMRLNADDVFAHVQKQGAFFVPFPIDGDALISYVDRTEYEETEKRRFRTGEITVNHDCVRFNTQNAINSYTVALLVNFVQDECINRGVSFSQETVFSHRSKIDALAKARAHGFRTNHKWQLREGGCPHPPRRVRTRALPRINSARHPPRGGGFPGGRR